MTTWLEDAIARNPTPPPLRLPQRFAAADLGQLPRAADGTLSTLHQTATKYLTNFWVDAPLGLGCLFIGRAGTYKTYAASAIARIAHTSGVDVEFVQVPLAFGRIDRNRFGDASAELVKRISTAPLVVMDDFSQVNSNSFGSGLLVELAEARFSNCRPTIWTGNIALQPGARLVNVLGNLYGASFSRRVTEGSKGYGVNLG